MLRLFTLISETLFYFGDWRLLCAWYRNKRETQLEPSLFATPRTEFYFILQHLLFPFPLPSSSAFLLSLTTANAVKDDEEDEAGAERTKEMNGVAKEKAGEKEGKDLPQGHHDGKDDRAKFLYGVEDEELTNGGRDGEDDRVEKSREVGHDELH